MGRSENISNRIDQHLYLEPQKNTYALKLNHREDLLKEVCFEINWIPFDTDPEQYFLIDRIESILRDVFMPIIGKQ